MFEYFFMFALTYMRYQDLMRQLAHMLRIYNYKNPAKLNKCHTGKTKRIKVSLSFEHLLVVNKDVIYERRNPRPHFLWELQGSSTKGMICLLPHQLSRQNTANSSTILTCFTGDISFFMRTANISPLQKMSVDAAN